MKNNKIFNNEIYLLNGAYKIITAILINTIKSYNLKISHF